MEKTHTHAQQLRQYYEPHRPQIHFSPKKNWMNDPNGCVYFNGLYHLYFQYHPYSTDWGPMHWGHAVSEDLLHWKEQPVALYPPSEQAMAFSGSAVVDKENSSGLFSEISGKQGIVAVYTEHFMKHHKSGEQLQRQCLAYSTDNGKTLKSFSANPILEYEGVRDFRDPKIIRHQESDAWIMIIAKGERIELYRSNNLMRWEKSDSFSLEGLSTDNLYECPDLISIDSEDGRYWLVIASLYTYEEAVKGVSVYAVGTFDGYKFLQKEPVKIIDSGYDFYAMQSWSDMPDERRVWIGWMNHWAYAHTAPTRPWRGMMSIPRELSIRRKDNGEHRLTQAPVQEIAKLRSAKLCLDVSEDGHSGITSFRTDGALEIRAEISARSDETPPLRNQQNNSYDKTIGDEYRSYELEFVFRGKNSGQLKICFDLMRGEVIVDRKNAFYDHPDAPFVSVVRAKIPERGQEAKTGDLDVQILLDQSVLEIFAGKGELAVSSVFFSEEPLYEVEVRGFDYLSSYKIFELRSIWEDEKYVPVQ